MSEGKYPLLNGKVYIFRDITIILADESNPTGVCDVCGETIDVQEENHLSLPLQGNGNGNLCMMHLECLQLFISRTQEAAEEHRLRLVIT